MRIGIGSSAYFPEDNPKEGLERMKAHGYDCMDYQRFGSAAREIYQVTDEEFEARLTEERRMIEEAGLRVWQIHGVCTFVYGEDGSLDLEDCLEKMKRCLHGAHILRAQYAVFHPMTPFGRGEQEDEERFFRVNRDIFSRLCETAEQEQVTICLENVPLPGLPLSRPEQTLSFVKSICHPRMKMCLDSGHCAVFGISPADAVRMIGKEYLGALHVHDNDGTADRHHLPYHGVIDWEEYRQALTDIGFEGVLSLECITSRKLPDGIKEHYEIGLAAIAKHLAGR